MLYFHLGSPTHRHSGPDFPIRNELSDHANYWHSLVGLIVIISPSHTCDCGSWRVK